MIDRRNERTSMTIREKQRNGSSECPHLTRICYKGATGEKSPTGAYSLYWWFQYADAIHDILHQNLQIHAVSSISTACAPSQLKRLQDNPPGEL